MAKIHLRVSLELALRKHFSQVDTVLRVLADNGVKSSSHTCKKCSQQPTLIVPLSSRFSPLVHKSVSRNQYRHNDTGSCGCFCKRDKLCQLKSGKSNRRKQFCNKFGL